MGAEAILAEAGVEGKRYIIPARWAHAACESVSWRPAQFIEDLCEAVSTDKYDFYLMLEGRASAAAGAALKGKGEIGYENGKFKLKAKAKAAAILGGSASGGFEVGKLKR